MKKIILFFLLTVTVCHLFAQTVEKARDNEGNRVVIGFLSRQQLSTDTSFAWFIKNQKDYVPYQKALTAIKANRDSLHFLVFGGTWCSDTKFVLPKFFVLADAGGIAPDHISIVGVDHNKKTIQNLSEIFNITNVPTILVFKNGKEIGRVIEYGKHGLFDEDLAEIIQNY